MSTYLAGVHGSRTHPGRDHRPATVLKIATARRSPPHHVTLVPVWYLKTVTVVPS
jgi:hypothetical protein